MMKKIQLCFVFCMMSVLMFSFHIHAQVLVDEDPSVNIEETKTTGYVYDLKDLIKKSRQSIKGVDQKIQEQAMLKRNQQREQKAREYYEQAQALAEQGRLKESRQLYEKAIRITEHPEMKQYVKQTVFRSKSQASALKKQEQEFQRLTDDQQRQELEKIEQSYQNAVSLYKQTKFQQAKDAFEYVEEMYPDYKAVRSYLQVVEQDIFQADQIAIKNQQKEISRQQKELEVARIREKEQWRKEIQQKEEQRALLLKKQAEAVYQEAIQFYKQQKYAAAKEKFLEVDWVLPDYRAVRAYLVRIERDIEKEYLRKEKEEAQELRDKSWEMAVQAGKKEMTLKEAEQKKEQERLEQVREQADLLYNAALALMEQEKIAQAKEKFDEVQQLYPYYKETNSYIQKTEQILKSQSEQEAARQKAEEEKRIWGEEAMRKKQEQALFEQKAVRAEALYQEASNLYKTGRLIEAKTKLVEVNDLVPDYKSTQNLLKRIDKDIELTAKTLLQESSLADQKAEIQRLQKQKDEAEKIYKKAMSSYAQKQYERAREEFNQVQQIYKDYKRTSFYLAKVDEDIEAFQKALQKKEKEQKAESIYQQAVNAYQQGQLEEAKAQLIAVQALIPDYKLTSGYLDKIDDDILAQKEEALAHLKKVQVEQPYAQAIAFYLQKDFVSAKAKFLEVVALMPQYKDTEKYIQKIDDDIQQQKIKEEEQKKQKEAEEEYAKAMSFYQQKDFAQAKKSFIKTEVIYPDFKNVGSYLARIDKDILTQQRQEEEQERVSKANPLYLEAVSLYKQQEFLEAKNRFEQVQVIYPSYKDTDSFLVRVEKDILKRQERLETLEKNRQAEELYLEAMGFYAQQNFLEAKEKFIQTSIVNPHYKNTAYYLKRIDTDIAQHWHRIEQLKLETQADVFYTEALSLYHSRQYEEAKEFFLSVAQILPRYKKTPVYLGQIEKNIKLLKKERADLLAQKVEYLYQQAQILLRQNKKEEAFENLYIIDILFSDYKNTKEQLHATQESLLQDNMNVNSIVAQATLKAKQEQDIFALKEESDALKTANSFYQQAIKLFQNHQYDQAKEDFQHIAQNYPQYRHTEKYLTAIDILKDLERQPHHSEKAIQLKKEKIQKVTASPKPPILEKSKIERTAKIPIVDSQSLVSSVPEVHVQKLNIQQLDALYIEALSLYKEGKHSESKEIFEQIEGLSTNYKSTKTYLKMIDEVMGKENMPPVVTSVVFDRSIDQDEVIIKELIARSERIYRQIKTLAEDKDLASTQKTFAKVDKILANIEAEQKRVSLEIEKRKKQEEQQVQRQMAMDQQKEDFLESQSGFSQEDMQRQERKHRKQEVVEGEREKRILRSQENKKLQVAYQQAIRLYRLKDYSQSKRAFIELHEMKRGYKNVDQMIALCERKESEELLVESENQDRQELMRLAQKATDMNIEILALSQQRNYEQIKMRFSDLESLLKQIQSLKNTMITRRDEWMERWNKKAKMQQEKTNVLLKEKDAAMMKEAEDKALKQKALVFYKEGQSFFSAKKYPEAKVKFLESLKLDPTKKATRSYLQKINDILDQQDRQFQWDVQQRVEKKMKANASDGVGGTSVKDILLEKQKQWRLMMDEAKSLYRQNHYQEARIKFNRLQKEAEGAYQKQADRYLVLIGKALAQERKKEEKAQRLREEQYLQERLNALKTNLQDKSKTKEPFSSPQTHQKLQSLGVQKKEWEQKDQKKQDDYRQKMIQQESQMQKTVSIKPLKERSDTMIGQSSVIDLKKFYAYKKQVDQEDARLLAQEAALRKQREEEKQKDTIIEENKKLSKETALEKKERFLSEQKQEQKLQIEKQNKALEKNLTQGVERLYHDAEALYSLEEYDKAYEYFQQIERIRPSYKKTRSYLKTLERTLAIKEKESIVEAIHPVSASSDMMKSSAIGHALDLFDPQVK